MRRLARFGAICKIEKTRKHPWRSDTFRSILHGCFLSFLNCTNGTKSRKASNIYNSVK